MEEDVNFENTIQNSEPFRYPSDSSLSEEDIEKLADELAVKKTAEFINKLLAITIPAPNTRVQLIAFAIACGVNVGYLLNCENTLAGISKSLGCTKAALSAAVKTVSEQYNIRTNTGISHEAKQTYKHTNYRNPSST